MKEIQINDKISYIECSEDPLSADIGIIRDEGKVWLFDVGCGEQNIQGLDGTYNIVLSHFHKDHTFNLDSLNVEELYVSKETGKHTHRGTIVTENLHIGNLHIFPLPSSHAKGCLGLEVDETYAFVGDALYSRADAESYIYNAQLLKEEIEVLKSLRAQYLLISHRPGLIRDKEEAIAELLEVYKLCKPGEPEIRIPRKAR